jgi:hypothetical protein
MQAIILSKLPTPHTSLIRPDEKFLACSLCNVSPHYEFVTIFKKNTDDAITLNMPFHVLHNTIDVFSAFARNLQSIIIDISRNS